MADVGEMDVEPQEQAATSVDNSNDAPAPAPDAHEEEPAQEPAGASHREEIVPDPETQPEEGSSSTAGRKNEVTVKVLMLDGTYVSFPCQRKVKAADVIERVHTELDTGEKDFFSLFFFFNNQKIFLDPEKTVFHQLPRDKRSVQPWNLNYGVKFYLPDPAKLKEDYSRYLYALQLCRDIRDNHVLTDRETATRLTALMLQATLGDYDPLTHKPGYTNDFEELFLIPKDSRPAGYEAQLIELHRSKAGYSPAQAEGEFCNVARQLSRYGYHLFGVQDEHGTLYLVANGFHGIRIYREREKIYDFPWGNIVKISYKRRKFRIKYHPVDSNGTVDTETVEQLKYYCGKQPAAKRVWKNAVEQHTFFRLNEPDPPNRINVLFRRGSRFRYSGRTLRQTMNDESRKQHDFQRSYSERAQKTSYESYAPGYVPSLDSFRRQRGIRSGQPQTRQIFIEREDPDSQKWVELDSPPRSRYTAAEQGKFEQQRVQVNFSVKDGVPQDEYKAVLRRSGGSMEVLTNGDDTTEPSYRLSAIDQNSQAILTSVSLRVDPEEGAEPGDHGDSAVVFDSTNLPSVKLNADTATSTTVIELSGKTLSSGGVTHSHQYTSTSVEVEATDGPPADMAQDDCPETIEVELFMKKEGELLKEVLSASTTEGNNEVED